MFGCNGKLETFDCHDDAPDTRLLSMTRAHWQPRVWATRYEPGISELGAVTLDDAWSRPTDRAPTGNAEPYATECRWMSLLWWARAPVNEIFEQRIDSQAPATFKTSGDMSTSTAELDHYDWSKWHRSSLWRGSKGHITYGRVLARWSGVDLQ